MKVHLIAFGESLMCNLATALYNLNYIVTGSDDSFENSLKYRLQEKGLLSEKMGWQPNKITEDLDFIILGESVKEDNPELIKARKLGLKVLSYPEYLYEHSKSKTRVVIAGSYGKTSIMAMTLHVLHYYDKKVDYMTGTQYKGSDLMLHLTDMNDFIILDGDESFVSSMDKRSKILCYRPNIALISGISQNNSNGFSSSESYIGVFETFIETMTDGGILTYNREDSLLSDIVSKVSKPIRKHPYDTPEYHAKDHQIMLKTPDGDLKLNILDKQSVSNLSGAKWLCQFMGIDQADFYEAISSYTEMSVI